MLFDLFGRLSVPELFREPFYSLPAASRDLSALPSCGIFSSTGDPLPAASRDWSVFFASGIFSLSKTPPCLLGWMLLDLFGRFYIPELFRECLLPCLPHPNLGLVEFFPQVHHRRRSGRSEQLLLFDMLALSWNRQTMR